jgi:hypothetical protein
MMRLDPRDVSGAGTWRCTMKVRTTLLIAVAVLGLVGVGRLDASDPLSAEPLEIPLALEQSIEDAVSACNCFTSVTPWQVSPVGTAAQVFSSEDVLLALVGQDIQLPWVAHGEINAQALATILTPSGQTGVLGEIAAFADPSGHGFRLGAYKWSYMTAPDYCSSETLYLMYFGQTGVLFAFRFDSSSEC